MAKDQQSYRDVLSRLEAKDKKGTSLEDAYDALSFLPGTGEAIAAYELPEVLSQSGKMISSDDFVEAAAGTGMATLGVASMLPIVGSAAKAARKGLEGFIPYLGPKTATAGGPDIDSSVMKMEGDTSGVSAVPDDLNLGSGSLFSPEVKKGRKLLIVSCSADKCPDPGDMEAFDRYTGDMFKSIKKQGIPEENVDLAIMSAKYGLIRRDTKIPTYNVKMNKEIANNLLKDPTHVNRIKNTIEGYDEVVVEGSDLYKGVVKEAAGDIPLRDFKVDFKKAVESGEVKPDGGYGSGRQKQSVGNFLRSNTPVDVYHFSMEPGFSKFDLDKLPYLDLGPHVGSTPKAASDRFFTKNYGIMPDLSTRYEGKTTDEILKDIQERGIKPTNENFLGGSIPLKADLSKPFLNPETKKPFTEKELDIYKANQLARLSNNKFSKDDLFFENPNVSDDDIRQAMKKLSRELAEKGFTHIPYINDFESKGDLSYVMLIDRPKDSKAVLKGKFGKNDPKERTNPDIMKEDGGVVSLKDKAVNMNRGPQGIEPFIKFMV
jgi:hypothetical protein